MTAQWFGEYEIIKQLRVGGMATLYLARRHGAAGFSRLVALKMIHRHLIAQPSFVEMFVDEARICSHISHPNVVHVEEFGELDGVHYLVMEYLDGCSVSELLGLLRREHRMLDPELAARVIMQVAGGLHTAHETRGPDGQPLEIIHRDISPSNILISVGGNAKLIDFGIAKARNRVTETQAGVSLKGKYSYVAPEQAVKGAVDRRCDIFSLGIVFWELLTGRKLFTEDNHIGLFNRLTQTDALAPSTANPAVPEVLDSIVLAMLQHDPVARPQTALEVQRRIASAIPGAANREASELGALAIEVRDKSEERRARRAASGAAGSDSNQSFSPTPSPNARARTVSGSRAMGMGTNEATLGAGVLISPPPGPSPWWRRRGLQVGAGLLGAGLLMGILLARQGRGADASAPPRHPSELELVAPQDSVPVRPAVRPPPAVESPPAAQPPTPSVAESPPAAPPPAAQPAPAPAPPEPSVTSAPPHESAPAAAPAPVRSRATPKREVVHTAPKPKLPRPAAGEPEVAKTAPAPQTPKATNTKTPFSAGQFDDAANTKNAPAAPDAAKDKKTPIAPGFDD
jgi:serine/threonine-protein kinase